MKNDEVYFEYKFLKTYIIEEKKPYYDTSIPAKNIEKLFNSLREKFNDTEICKDYSFYKKGNMVMTVFPDGSSFCNQLTTQPLEDKNLKESSLNNPQILVTYNKKSKVSNDVFPLDYVFDDVYDIIDTIFNWDSNISVIFSTKYQSDILAESKTVKTLGRPQKINTSDQLWCEVFVRAKGTSSVEEIHKCLDFVKNNIK